MNISKKCHEIVRIVTWFTLETILEEMTEMQIFLIVVLGIRDANTLDDGRQIL